LGALQQGADDGQPRLVGQGFHDGDALFGLHRVSPDSIVIELKMPKSGQGVNLYLCLSK